MSKSKRSEKQSPAPHGAHDHDLIRVQGARENNLKEINVELPKRRLTVESAQGRVIEAESKEKGALDFVQASPGQSGDDRTDAGPWDGLQVIEIDGTFARQPIRDSEDNFARNVADD